MLPVSGSPVRGGMAEVGQPVLEPLGDAPSPRSGDDPSMDIAGLIVGVVVGLLGVCLIADVFGRMYRNHPEDSQKLREASLGGRIALGSPRVRVAYGIACLVVALLVIAASS